MNTKLTTKPVTIEEAIYIRIDDFFDMHTFSEVENTLLKLYDYARMDDSITEIEKDNIHFRIHNQCLLLRVLESVSTTAIIK